MRFQSHINWALDSFILSPTAFVSASGIYSHHRYRETSCIRLGYPHPINAWKTMGNAIQFVSEPGSIREPWCQLANSRSLTWTLETWVIRVPGSAVSGCQMARGRNTENEKPRVHSSPCLKGDKNVVAAPWATVKIGRFRTNRFLLFLRPLTLAIIFQLPSVHRLFVLHLFILLHDG